jgi:hypothetical protein
VWYKSQPVKWYELVSEMEEFRQRSGWSLAETWGHLHRGDYEAARSSFDQVKAHFHQAHGARYHQAASAESLSREASV